MSASLPPPIAIFALKFFPAASVKISSIASVRSRSASRRFPSAWRTSPCSSGFFLKKYNEAYGKKIAGLTRRAQTLLLQHPWPGNVRELENVISTACITAAGDFIDLSDLPEHLQHPNTAHPGREDWHPLPLDEVRMQHIQKVLEMCNGNRLRAAKILGIGRTSLYRYLKRDNSGSRPDPQPSGAAA